MVEIDRVAYVSIVGFTARRAIAHPFVRYQVFKISIFNVFLNSQLIHTLKIKVTPYAKLPYMRENRKYHKINYKAYHEIHNMMYCVDRGSLKTYFYSRNNVINYYTRQSYGVELFTLDVQSGTYRPIRFQKLRVPVKDENSILIKTEKGKWYIITTYYDSSSELEYIVIIDALNGACLYKEQIVGDGNLYVDILYPVANRILPVIHITRWDVYVKLFDMDNENIYTITTTNLKDIDSLVNLIMDNAKNSETLRDNPLNCEVDYIESVYTWGISYLYGLYNEKIIYTRGLKIELSLNLKLKNRGRYQRHDTCELRYLLLCVELDNKDLNCYLDLSKVELHLIDENYERHILYNVPLKPIIYKYPISDNINDICLSTCLYKDQCYYIYNRHDGIGIIKVPESDYLRLSYSKTALYRYSNYLIIFFLDKPQNLVIIDTEKNKIGFWECEYCNSLHSTKYIQYYSKKQDKLIFLSTETANILVIDLNKIRFIFKSNKHSDCIGNFGDSSSNKDKLCDVRYCVNIAESLAEAITRVKGYEVVVDEDQFKLISHYFDIESDTLYIFATYVIYATRYIGVFSLRILHNNFNFEVLHHIETHSSEIIILSNVLEHRNLRRLSMSKTLLYRFSVDRAGDLDMAYNETTKRLISIRHNRNSIDITKKRYAVLGLLSVDSFKDLIAVTYLIADGDDVENLALLFIKSELSLVRAMTATEVQSA